MKKKLVTLILFSIILLYVSLSASAQIYVKIRPVMPTVVITERPSSAHVWIGEEWNEDRGNYKYSGGRWETPPHPGYRWEQGHWNHHKEHGDQWIRGRWKGPEKKRR